MKRKGYKLLAWMLSVLMLWSMLPITALAEDATPEVPAVTEEPAKVEEEPSADPTVTPPPADPTATPSDLPTEEPTPTPELVVSPSEEPLVTPEPSATPSPSPVPELAGFELLFADGGVIIARYVGGEAQVVVPATVGDMPVTTVLTGAFSNLENLTSVEVAQGVRTVQGGAFANCPALTEIKLPASLSEIAENAVTGCPLAVITAPEGSPAAAYAESYALSLLTVETMDDPLPEVDLDSIFDINLDTTKMHLTPDGYESVNLLAVFNPTGSADSVENLSDWNMSVRDSGGHPVEAGIILVYIWHEDGQEQLRVNVRSVCETGTYTLLLRGSTVDTLYTHSITFEVASAPKTNFDDAVYFADDLGRDIPSTMLIGDATIGYSGRIQMKDGSGLDRCELERVDFNNWSIINLNWGNDWIDLQPHDSGSDTLTIRVRGYYGCNQVYYEKTYDISVAEADFERPSLTLTNTLDGDKLVVGAGATGVNVPFTLTYNIEGGEHVADYAANVKLHAQTPNGSKYLVSNGGDSYSFTEAGLYPVALVATYMNTTISYNFFVQVLGAGGVAPAATFDSYFSMEKNENGDCGALYFAPSLAISHWVAGFKIVKGAPFAASDVSYDISFIGNDEGAASTLPCATIEMAGNSEEGWYHEIKALPNTVEGAGPAFSRYRLTATVKQADQPDVAYSTEFGVNMVALEGIENMPNQTLSLTADKISLAYRTDNTYTVTMPGILLGGKTLPKETWLEVYSIDHNNNQQGWDFLLDSEDNTGRETVLKGQTFNTSLFYDRAEVLKMRYAIDYGNLRWEAPFTIYLGVGETDASALFDVNQQAYAAFIGGRADEFAWGGSFYNDDVINVEDFGVESVSVPIGGSIQLVKNDNPDATRTDISFGFAPSKPGTYKVRLWADVDEDNNEETAAVRYDHVFTLKAILTPANLPTSMSLVDGNQKTVEAGEHFGLLGISIDPTVYSQYGWFNNQMIWGIGNLQDSGDWSEHGPTGNHQYWVDTPGRYKLVREFQIGANYFLREFVALTVTNEANETVVTDVSEFMNGYGWDDAYAVLPKGDASNDLCMLYVNDLLLGDDVTEEWKVLVSGDSVGKFGSYQFADQYKGDQDRSSEARLVGLFPIKTGEVKFTVVYDAYQGSGLSKVHIYHGEIGGNTLRIVDDKASGDFRLVGTPKTYYTDATGFVHIDAFDAVSNDVDLSTHDVHNDYHPGEDPNGYVQLTAVNDAGEDDWQNNTGVDVRIDPTKKGTYLIYQHSWVSLEDTDLSTEIAFRVVVGSTTGSTLKVNENDMDLSVLNLRDSFANLFEKYYWVDAAVGEKLTWKITRTKGTSVDLGVVGKDGKCVSTVNSVITDTYQDNAIAIRVVGFNGVGLSTFELSTTLTTVDGKVLTTKKTFNVNIVDVAPEGYLPTLTAETRVFNIEVGDSVEIPQPTIAWPTGASKLNMQRYWFWGKGDRLGGYTNDVDESTRNVILYPLEAGCYSIYFEAAVGVSAAVMSYTVIVSNPGEAAPTPEAQMHAERNIGDYEEYYDTDHDGLIQITGQMDEGAKVFIPAAVFSMWGMSNEDIDALTFTLDTPDDTGAIEARISKRLGDCTILYARYLKEIGNPVTYTIHALIDGVDTGKSVQVTLLPPRVPTVLDGFKTLTISTGMTYQLDVAALSDALGKTVTKFSCDYDGKTATDTRFTVSNTGLITAKGAVTKAYVYAETDDPPVFAVIEVIVKGAAASFTASNSELTFTDLTTPQTLTIVAKDSLGNPVPAAIAVSGSNPAVCICEYEGVDDVTNTYTYTITPIGCGSTSITFKAMGATVTIPVTVKRVLTGVTLTAPETILAGASGTVSAVFEPADASDKSLVWSTAFAEGQDTTGFNNAWITMNNGVISVSKALDRVTEIVAVANWTVDGVKKTASAPLTLLPLVTAVTIQPSSADIVKVGTQYVYDLSKLDDETEIGFKATVSPSALAGFATGIQWTSSASAVASIDQNGVVTPIKLGTTNITATAMDGSKKSQTITLVVRKFVTDVIPASSKGLSLVAGSGLTLSLTAACLPLDATLKTVTWTSDTPSLLSVNPTTGVVTAVKGATISAAAEVVITATATDGSQKSGTISLNVVPKATSVVFNSIGENDVTSPTTPINLDIQTLIDEDGNIAPLALSATVMPEDGYPITWTSSNPGAAAITYDEVGNAYLTLYRAASRVTITAVAGSNKLAKATALVNVINTGVVAPAKVTVTGASALAAGTSATYVATVEPAAATNKSVTWKLVDAEGNDIVNANIATLSQTGLLKISALVNLTTTSEVYVKAIAKGATGVESELYRVSLFAKATGVTISGPEDSLVAGKEVHFIDVGSDTASITLTADVSPAAAQQAVVWSSSNTKVLTVAQDPVDPCKAVVTSVGIGTAKIVATTLDGTKRKAEYTVTVGTVTSSLSLTEDYLEMAAGGKLNLAVDRTPALVSNPALVWTCSDSKVATVSSAGLVTAKTVTTATLITITVTAADRPGLSDTMQILVRPKAVSVTLMDGEDNVLTATSNLTLTMYAAGEDQEQLSAVCNPHMDDAAQGALQSVVYSSSNPAVASVDAATGLVTAKKAGTAKITATATDGSKKAASVNVTVVCAPTSITVTGPEGVAIGKSVTLKAAIAPDGVAAQGITWSIVTGSDLATISKTGVLTVKKGVAADQTIEVMAKLTAYPSISYIFETKTTTPVTSVATNYGTGSKAIKVPLYQGNLLISAMCAPGTALNQVTFTSGNTKVATVDQNGEVTFLTTGTAVITVAAIDGSNCKTVLTITVTK